jgi:amino acid permease
MKLIPVISFPVLTVTIAVSLQDRPASAPQTNSPWVSDYKIVGSPSFTTGITAICNLVFAFSGTPGFFAIISEMRDPRKYTFALLLCQAGVTGVYIIVGCIVYYYCGSYVSSPALGSAGGDVKKIAYGFALPGLIVTTTICSHVSSQARMKWPFLDLTFFSMEYRYQQNSSLFIYFAAPGI